MFSAAKQSLQAAGISDILAVYSYGSRVYGVDTPSSDYDYIAVTDATPHVEELAVGNVDVHIFSESQFKERIDSHEISALECLWLPGDKHEGCEFSFVLDKKMLRKSISSKASNSWVKAKKKLADGELYIAKKSLWHSFRIIDFGTQIANYSRITGYSTSNYLYSDIVNCENNDWDYYVKKYKKLHNHKMSEFRKICPK